MKFLETKENKIFRDVKSMALVNTDMASLNKYKEEKRRQNQMKNVIDDVENLKNDITDIKQLLQRLVEKDG